MSDYKANSNDRLEKLLVEYKKNSTIEKLTELAEELRKSNVHMPCKADDDNRIAAMIIRTNDGKNFIPVYSSKWHLNGKMKPGQRVAVLPFTEVNKIALNENKINCIDGIVVNPQDTNIVLNMNFAAKIQQTEEEEALAGNHVTVDFRNPVTKLNNAVLEEQMEKFAAEEDSSARQAILNGILNILREANVAVPLGKNAEGKNAPLVMTNNTTGEKYTPVYTNNDFAAERHKDCQVALFPFDKANEIALKMSGEVDGLCVISRKVTVNLKTRLLENVKEVNDRIRNQRKAGTAGNADSKAGVSAVKETDPVKAEQLKFTMKTLPQLIEKRGQKLIDTLIERREACVDELYENAYYDIRMYPFVREEFTVTAITAAPQTDAIEIEFPAKGTGEGSAARAYIIWDSENKKSRYFGVCRNADDAMMIIEVADGKQTFHGISAIETNEMSRILDICGV